MLWLAAQPPLTGWLFLGWCRAPPPHLSPFVVEEEEGYMPEYGQQLKQLQRQ